MLIFSIIIQLVILVLTLATPVGIAVGIVLAVVMSREQDATKKKNLKWWTISSFIGPIVLLFVVLSIWGLVSIATGTAHVGQ